MRSGELWRHGQLSAEPLQLLISIGQRVRKNVDGPAAAMLLLTPALIPCTAADMTVTTNTPTAMPSTVRPVRTLFPRMAANAIATPSTSEYNRAPSLIPASSREWDRAARRGRPGR